MHHFVRILPARRRPGWAAWRRSGAVVRTSSGKLQCLEITETWTVVRDTIKDIETPTDVKALMDQIAGGATVEKTVLIEHLERMLRLVVRTDADFDGLVLLVKRRTALSIRRREPDAFAVHALPDRSALLHTTFSMASRARVRDRIVAFHPAWIAEHVDPRGVPCFRASQLEVACAASSYDDALYLLGDTVVFL